MLVTQVCPALFDPMDFSPPGSSVHGVLQAAILKWVPFPPSGLLHTFLLTVLPVAEFKKLQACLEMYAYGNVEMHGDTAVSVKRNWA